MAKTKSPADKKIENYLNQLFAGVGQSQQLFDLKEELHTNMKEKITDFKSKGMEEDQAFKEAVVSMGDLSGLVEDMREAGRADVRETVYSSMSNRVSVAGLVTSILLILFGVMISSMLYFMDVPAVSSAGATIFIVAGGALMTYSVLTRETAKKFAMNRARATLYALAVGLVLFGFYIGATSGFATNEVFIAISSSMSFLLIGVGLWLGLIFTGTSSRKKG